MNHTPLPWRVHPKSKVVIDNEMGTVASCFNAFNLRDEWEANAAFIVRAVNNFERAIRYLEIEHRKEKSQSFHVSDCDLCEFIANAETK